MGDATHGRRRVGTLVISRSPIGAHMSGAAIRSVELARVLAAALPSPVVLAAPAPSAESAAGVNVRHYALSDPRALAPLIAEAGTILTQPHDVVVARWLRASAARLIVDLYDPEPLEVIESFAVFAGHRRRRLALMLTTDRLLTALRDADHVMCASETQRSLWLGAMLAEGLIHPGDYDADPSFRERIDLVPFGVPENSPRATTRDPRSVLGLAPGTEIILWNGGVWPWLDIETPIRALKRLESASPRAHLVVLGASNTGPAAGGTARASALARDLDLTARVHLVPWVPYAERADWLLAANCSVSCHTDHLETRFAYRTRLLDCVWAGLPIVCTRGDELADRIQRDGMGLAVDVRDEGGVADGIAEVLRRGRAQYAVPLAAFAGEAAWPRVAEPLVRWVRDKAPPARRDRVRGPLSASFLRSTVWRMALEMSRRLGRPAWSGT